MMKKEYDFIPYSAQKLSVEESLKRSEEYFNYSNQRRSIREFSSDPIPYEIIENIIKTASTAPSGANKQPWTFCVVSDPKLKSEIRKEAEEEEYKSYNQRMPQDWLDDLEPLGTDWHKPFLETAPYLIVVMKRAYEWDEEGNKKNNYYVNESVGLAAGYLLSAIHNAGLVSLTHTPSPMNFLAKLLNRPENERPFLLIPVGYPAEQAMVPDIKRKALKDILVNYP